MTTRLAKSLTFAVLVCALPLRAEAQVGGIINRAKKAVVDDNKTVSNAQLGDPFDTASLDAAIKGMRVYKSRMAEVAALQKQYLDNQKNRSTLQEKNQRQIDEYNVNKDKIGDCVRAYSDMNGSRQQELMQKKMSAMMAEPAAYQGFLMEMARISQEMQAAYAKGDTVAVKKLTQQQQKALGVDAKADSIAAAAKCGTVPPRPAALAEIERLDKQNEQVNLRLRSAESSADVDGARAAGVQPARFQQMRERLTTWAGKPDALGSKEGALLKGRKSEIEDVIKTP